MANWATERRLDFIEDQLVANGRVNRSDVAAFFGVTVLVAGNDIVAYCARNPRVVYDPGAKTFRWRNDARREPVRGSTPARRKAWALFARRN